MEGGRVDRPAARGEFRAETEVHENSALPRVSYSIVGNRAPTTD